MSKKPAKSSGGSPYKVLYWMGAGVVVLLLGIVALAVLNKPEPRVTADPARTVIWLYDDANKGGPGQVAILEESVQHNALRVVPFPAPEDARKAYASGRSSNAVQALSSSLGRKMHYRLFLPYSVVVQLIDAFGGVRVDGKDVTGSAAIAYIKEGGDQGARRAASVMLGLAEAASQRMPNMGVSEGLALANKVDTSFELTSLPTVLGRWNSYPSPKVETPANFDPAELQKLLLPDPPEPAGK